MGYPNIVVCGRNSSETPPRYELYTSGRREPILADITELLGIIQSGRSSDAAFAHLKIN